jgi:hypothetical protein
MKDRQAIQAALMVALKTKEFWTKEVVRLINLLEKRGEEDAN